MFMTQDDLQNLARLIKAWAIELGFSEAGICDTDLKETETHLQNWLEKNFHGDMQYMARHGLKRTRPALIFENTRRVISCRMNYLPEEDQPPETLLEEPAQAFISRYALGRDYHKVLRKRLQTLTNRINHWLEGKGFNEAGHRVFVDSAPVMEKALAQKAGLGWIGKHTNLLDRDAGSWFFLGEIYTTLELPVDTPVSDHCGQCTACIDICPTDAIIAPYQLDARRCISYLTIELQDSIPEQFRSAIGNRIYGCDDCQQICPWNRFAKNTLEEDFMPRHGLNTATLLELFNWDEKRFLKNTEGSAIRRLGYLRWLRNIAVALGNGPADPVVRQALKHKRQQLDSEMVIEHIDWALSRLA